MTDTEGFRSPHQGASEPAPQPRRMACPRCRGVFEGDPEVCPHCGLSKADIPTLRAEATVSPTAAPQSTPAAPVVSQAAPAVPYMAPAPPSAAPPEPPLEAPAPESEPGPGTDGRPRSGKRRRLLVAGAVALLAAAGVGWWLTAGGGAKKDPCEKFREEMAQVQARDYENSREERRAVSQVTGRALDAGCDVSDAPVST